jgi:protein-S-isoprenylcysteine O-methyltransferase Ste14
MTTGWMPPALGRRGEGWVVLQVVVLGLIVVAGRVGDPWADRIAGALTVVGLALVVVGPGLAIAGMRHLGPALTPYPKPGDGAELREHGSYRLVRHPIYGGLLVGGTGWALVTSPLTLLPVAALAAVFWGKATREEAWLDERYEGYAAYRARVRHRFVPFVW